MVTSSSSSTEKANATWVVRRGLADSSCVSFEARNYPANFLRHYAGNLHIAANGGLRTYEAASLRADDVSWVVSSPWAQ